MKTFKRLFNMLFNRTNIDEKNDDLQDLGVKYENENGGSTVIESGSWLKRKQDSIKEILLMCMTPYM